MTHTEFWEKQEKYNSYDKYKNEVKYDYDISVKMPITFELDNGDEAEIEHFDFIDDETGFEQDIASLIDNEDWLQGPFDDIALGRVYPKLVNDVADNIELLIGISLKDCEEPSKVTLETLKEDTIELLKGIMDNVEQQHFQNQESDNGPDYIVLNADINKADIQVKTNNEEVREQYIKQTLTDIDKRLVKESTLTFTKDNNQRMMTLNDDGVIECLENNKWVNSQPFSRIKLEKMCRETLEDGYILTLKQLDEAQIKTKNGEVIDTDKEKENMEQAKEELADIKQAKEEIDNTVNEIFGEDKLNESEDITQFPSTDFSKLPITITGIDELSSDELTPEQLMYINKVVGGLDNLKKELHRVAEIVGLQEDECFKSLDMIISYYTQFYKK